MCIDTAPSIRIAMPYAPIDSSEGTQIDITSKRDNKTFREPITIINQLGSPYVANSSLMLAEFPPRQRVGLLNLMSHTLSMLMQINALMVMIKYSMEIEVIVELLIFMKKAQINNFQQQ